MNNTESYPFYPYKLPQTMINPNHKTPTNQEMPDADTVEVSDDHFIIKDGLEYSGTHILFDLWGASRLDDRAYIEEVLIDCVSACQATLLHIHLHQFSDTGGISGVAVLAESHISVHTWPERHYAAFDVFMCGSARPENAKTILQKAFTPSELNVKEILRGHREDQ